MPQERFGVGIPNVGTPTHAHRAETDESHRRPPSRHSVCNSRSFCQFRVAHAAKSRPRRRPGGAWLFQGHLYQCRKRITLSFLLTVTMIGPAWPLANKSMRTLSLGSFAVAVSGCFEMSFNLASCRKVTAELPDLQRFRHPRPQFHVLRVRSSLTFRFDGFKLLGPLLSKQLFEWKY